MLVPRSTILDLKLYCNVALQGRESTLPKRPCQRLSVDETLKLNLLVEGLFRQRAALGR